MDYSYREAKQRIGMHSIEGIQIADAARAYPNNQKSEFALMSLLLLDLASAGRSMDILITVLDRYIRNGLMRSKSMDDDSLAEEAKEN